jgi:hypothetical protein
LVGFITLGEDVVKMSDPKTKEYHRRRPKRRSGGVFNSVFGSAPKLENLTLEEETKKEIDWKTFKDEIYVETKSFPVILKNPLHGEYLLQSTKFPGKVVHNIFDTWQVIEHHSPLYVPEPLKYKKETSHVFVLDIDEEKLSKEIYFDEKTLGQDLGPSNSALIKKINSENSLKAEVSSQKRDSLKTMGGLQEGVSFLKKHSSLGRSTFLGKITNSPKAKSLNSARGGQNSEIIEVEVKEKRFYFSLFEENRIMKIFNLSESIKNILPPDVLFTSEKIEFTNNLLSFCKPIDWTPTEETFCGRYTDQTFQFYEFEILY